MLYTSFRPVRSPSTFKPFNTDDVMAIDRFKDIDKAFIEQLSDLVIIIPIISKADTMTMDERRVYLLQVHQSLLEMSTQLKKSIIYDFEESSPVEAKQSPKIFDHYPEKLRSSDETQSTSLYQNDFFRCPNLFAVVADTKKVRVYPWGRLSIEDETHSDFRRLQRLLFEEGLNFLIYCSY